jgi:hypothetical protein
MTGGGERHQDRERADESPGSEAQAGGYLFLDVFMAAFFSMFSGRHPGGRIIPAYLENRNPEGKDDRR